MQEGVLSHFQPGVPHEREAKIILGFLGKYIGDAWLVLNPPYTTSGSSLSLCLTTWLAWLWSGLQKTPQKTQSCKKFFEDDQDDEDYTWSLFV